MRISILYLVHINIQVVIVSDVPAVCVCEFVGDMHI